jgi:hypothetical protein
MEINTRLQHSNAATSTNKTVEKNNITAENTTTKTGLAHIYNNCSS